MTASEQEAKAQRRGVMTILFLALMTIAEYISFAAIDDSTALLVALAPQAVIEALVILWNFMHLPMLWRGEGGHE